MRQIILIPADTGGFTVEVPRLPGCITEGDTREEPKANAREAIELWIDDAIEHGEEIPDDVPAEIQIARV